MLLEAISRLYFQALAHTDYSSNGDTTESNPLNTHMPLFLQENVSQDFPGGTVDKNPPADAGDMG